MASTDDTDGGQFTDGSDGALYGSADVPGTANDFAGWTWQQIEAAIVGGAKLLSGDQAQALSVSDPTTLWTAGDIFNNIQLLVQDVGNGLQNAAKQLAGGGDAPWQGDAAQAFYSMMQSFSSDVLAAANVLGGGPSGVDSVPQQLIANGNALSTAQAEIEDIDSYYAQAAVAEGAPVMSNGLVEVSKKPVLVAEMTSQMLTVLDQLSSNYQVMVDGIVSPATVAPPGTAASPASGLDDPATDGADLTDPGLNDAGPNDAGLGSSGADDAEDADADLDPDALGTDGAAADDASAGLPDPSQDSAVAADALPSLSDASGTSGDDAADDAADDTASGLPDASEDSAVPAVGVPSLSDLPAASGDDADGTSAVGDLPSGLSDASADSAVPEDGVPSLSDLPDPSGVGADATGVDGDLPSGLSLTTQDSAIPEDDLPSVSDLTDPAGTLGSDSLESGLPDGVQAPTGTGTGTGTGTAGDGLTADGITPDTSLPTGTDAVLPAGTGIDAAVPQQDLSALPSLTSGAIPSVGTGSLSSLGLGAGTGSAGAADVSGLGATGSGLSADAVQSSGTSAYGTGDSAMGTALNPATSTGTGSGTTSSDQMPMMPGMGAGATALGNGTDPSDASGLLSADAEPWVGAGSDPEAEVGSSTGAPAGGLGLDWPEESEPGALGVVPAAEAVTAAAAVPAAGSPAAVQEGQEGQEEMPMLPGAGSAATAGLGAADPSDASGLLEGRAEAWSGDADPDGEEPRTGSGTAVGGPGLDWPATRAEAAADPVATGDDPSAWDVAGAVGDAVLLALGLRSHRDRRDAGDRDLVTRTVSGEEAAWTERTAAGATEAASGEAPAAEPGWSAATWRPERNAAPGPRMRLNLDLGAATAVTADGSAAVLPEADEPQPDEDPARIDTVGDLLRQEPHLWGQLPSDWGEL
jgi:hypothetical protein